MVAIRRFPSLPTKLKYRATRWLEQKRLYNDLRRKFVSFHYPSIADEITLQWIDPNDITMMQVECDETDTNFRYNYDRVPLHSTDKARFNPHHYAGVVLSGNWDKYVKPYEFDRVYRGIRRRFEEGVPWEDTEYITQYQLREDTYQVSGYAEREVEKTEELAESIRQNGFLSRYELGQLTQADPPYLRQDQWGITVNIGRNGDFIFNNTAHNRLALSKVFNLPEIPVLVVVRHSEWCEKQDIPLKA